MRKMRKFNDGGSTDAEEAKYKAIGLAASNAENKKSSGFFGRLAEGNIDQKGSAAYEKYGAGYGRKLEAEKAAKAPEAAAPAPAPTAKAPDKSYDTLESKRLSSPASKPDETPDKSYDALESKRLSSPTPAPKADKEGEDAMARAASRVARAPAAKSAPTSKAPTAKAPAAKPATKAPARTPVAETKTQRARLDVPNAAGPRSAASPMSRDPSQRSAPAPTPVAKSAPAPAPTAKPVDETKLSLSDRMKLSRERAKSSSTGTDTRPVGQRIRESLGMKKGGGVKGYASGGSVSSRADGIAQRGKTRGKMC